MSRFEAGDLLGIGDAAMWEVIGVAIVCATVVLLTIITHDPNILSGFAKVLRALFGRGEGTGEAPPRPPDELSPSAPSAPPPTAKVARPSGCTRCWCTCPLNDASAVPAAPAFALTGVPGTCLWPVCLRLQQ